MTVANYRHLFDNGSIATAEFAAGQYRLGLRNDFFVNAAVNGIGSDFDSFSGSFGFNIVPSTVPEPASWALLIGGFGAVGGAVRRRSGGRAAAA